MAFPRGAVPTTVPVQPTALYETLAMFAVFLVLYRLARKPQPGWYVFAWFLVLSGVERFAVRVSAREPDSGDSASRRRSGSAISGILIGSRS